MFIRLLKWLFRKGEEHGDLSKHRKHTSKYEDMQM